MNWPTEQRGQCRRKTSGATAASLGGTLEHQIAQDQGQGRGCPGYLEDEQHEPEHLRGISDSESSHVIEGGPG